MSHLGYKHINEIKYIDEFSFSQKFILNKILFRGGNYSLSFIYTRSGDPSDYYKLSKKFDFYFDNKIFESNYSDENAYGSIIYPNTL